MHGTIPQKIGRVIADLVFHPQPDTLWKAIQAEKGWKFKLLADAPDDLSWN